MLLRAQCSGGLNRSGEAIHTGDVTKDGSTIAGESFAELDAFPQRLVATREQPRQALPALLQATRRCWLETYLMFQAFACTKELIE
jgi:hypothetical protein